MRISTLQAFNNGISGVQRNYANASKTQDRIGSGTRIATAGDDPVGAVRLQQLQQQQGMLDQYKSNLSSATNSLSQQESALNSATNVLQRVRELAVQAGNGALSTTERQAIAAEMGEREDELLGLMNSRNERGEYLFSGFQSKTQPFVREADGSYSYQGDEGRRSLQVSSSLSLPVSDNGKQIFEGVTNASRLSSAVATRTSGSLSVAVSKVDEAKAFSGQNKFPQGGVVLRFQDATTFDIYAAPYNNGDQPLADGTGLQMDADATTTDSFSFRGVQIDLSGAAATGDEVKVSSLSVSNALVSDEVAFGAALDGFPKNGIVLRFGENGAFDIYDADDSTTPLATGFGLDSKPLTSDSFTFRGVTFQLDGMSAAGDEVAIAPDNMPRQGLLDTIATLRKTLESPASTNKDVRDAVAASLANLDHGMTSVDAARSSIGARLNVAESTLSANEETSVINQSIQSEVGDLDYAEALSTLSMQTLVLQAAQDSYVKLSNLTLFNAMR